MRFAVALALPTWIGVGEAMAESRHAPPPAEVALAEPVIPTIPRAETAPVKATRFVIALERRVDYQVISLPNPNRVIVDLPNVKLRLPPSLRGAPVGIVSGFRAGLGAPGKMRVVIDVTEPVVVEKSEITASGSGPVLLTLEIAPVAVSITALVQAAVATSPSAQTPRSVQTATLRMIQPPVPRRAERPGKHAAKKTYKPLIVLDPGHGGHDSGAVRNGTVEKDVVLAFAKTLRDQLRASGLYRVEMTRDTDTFIPLEDRRSFAEEHNAALFIAIHADYATSRARGATIYSLRDSVATSLAASARRESPNDALSSEELASLKALGGQAPMVKGILADLVTRETQTNRDRTGTFVRAVIEKMGHSTSMNENPDRTAAFQVLLTAKVPAVLIELAYVTNRADAALLRSEEWRGNVAKSIRSAIDNYFSHQGVRLPL
ncbi:MAG: N-acetylmuramoyl-L-alanine amidase [Hyphomicrobiaceae bacterium]